jgi:nitrogen regulatory protein P-II 1
MTQAPEALVRRPMKFKFITATINISMVDKVEQRLRKIAAPGLSVSKVQGYGAHKNFFQRDLMTTHARLQIYAPENRVVEIVDAIMDAGGTGSEDDGIVAVSPVDAVYRIGDKKEAHAEEF